MKQKPKMKKSTLRFFLVMIFACLLLPVGLTACSSDDDDWVTIKSDCYAGELLGYYDMSATVRLTEIPQKDSSNGKLKRNTVVKIDGEDMKYKIGSFKLGETIPFKIVKFKEFEGNQYLGPDYIEFECVVEPCK